MGASKALPKAYIGDASSQTSKSQKYQTCFLQGKKEKCLRKQMTEIYLCLWPYPIHSQKLKESSLATNSNKKALDPQSQVLFWPSCTNPLLKLQSSVPKRKKEITL